MAATPTSAVRPASPWAKTSDPLLEIVIVVSTGAREHVRACLESLRRYPLEAGRTAVYVIDNASTDGTPEMVRDEFPEVELQTLPWNAGFCIANNVVLRRAKARYVLLLNPDTEVTSGALDWMVRLMDERPDIGMASCRLVQPDGTFDHAAKRSFPTPLERSRTSPASAGAPPPGRGWRTARRNSTSAAAARSTRSMAPS